MRKTLFALLLFLSLCFPAASQQAAPSPLPPPSSQSTPDFLATADTVLKEMSALLGLPVKTPLKKSLRSREGIRAYVIKRFEEEETPEERYARQKTLEALGLIPHDFALHDFLIELLTEQIAGLYDPKAGEFFIADWIPVQEQETVMAHELVHALQDQHFHLDPWMEAVKKNEDASMARSAVAEGSAMAAMMEHILHTSVRSMPSLSTLLNSETAVEMSSTPVMAQSPPFIRDSLMFPYLAGAVFTQQVLKSGAGWQDFNRVFANPPVSTQQILHPELYLSGAVPAALELELPAALKAKVWKKLDENVLGEFGVHAMLKQFLGKERADRIAPSWAGDRYAIFENTGTRRTLLVQRLRFSSEENAILFFGPYSEALESKYEKRAELFRRPNFFQFLSDDEGVYLYCFGAQCLAVEGADRKTFDSIVRAQGWPLPPSPPVKEGQRSIAWVLPLPLGDRAPAGSRFTTHP